LYLEFVLFRLRKLQGKLLSNLSFIESRRWRGSLFRFVCMIAHVPPGVNGLFTVQDLFDDEVTYSYRMINVLYSPGFSCTFFAFLSCQAVSFLCVASVMAYLISIFERPGKNHSSYSDSVLNSDHLYALPLTTSVFFVTL
jgi:hypothetical protein